MSLTRTIDPLLTGAIASGDVPGVVAIAADRSGVIYQGAFGKRILGGAQPMTLDTVGWMVHQRG